MGAGTLATTEPPAAAETGEAAGHDYLEVDGQRLESGHALPFVLELPERFEPRADLDYPQVWNDIPFRVSVAIFESDDALVQVFAETLPEGYGRLDYSELPPREIAGVQFHLRERCLDLREPTDGEGSPSLQALADLGLTGSLIRQQYFITTDDGLAELVLSYEKKASSCDEGTEDFRAAVSREAEKAFSSLRRLR